MKLTEYSRYLSSQTTSGVVIFSKRDELLEFCSILMGEKYKNYLNTFSGIASTERMNRITSEPLLVRLATTTYLESCVPYEDNSGIGRLLKKLFKVRHKLLIDNNSNTELYRFILSKIGQKDELSDVFTDDMLYTIEEDRTLKMVHI